MYKNNVLFWTCFLDSLSNNITASLVAQMVKNLPAMKEIWVQSLGWEDLLEEGMATHSINLAWRISMDKGAWWATVHLVGKESDTTERLSTICLCVCVCVCARAQSWPTLCNPSGLQPTRLHSPWHFSSKILEQVVISFSRESSRHRQGSNLSLLYGRLILYH